jgi:hypothetical protein
MATSGQTIYQLNRNAIISAALRKIGVLAKGQTADSTDLANGQEALNAIIAECQTLGMPLWARAEYSVTLVAGQRDYTLGVGQTIATPFPLKIQKANLVVTGAGMSAQEVFPVARQDFVILSMGSTGTPNSYSYQPFVNYGVLSLWPKPDTVAVNTYTLKLTYQRPFEGFTAANETPDFPQEWQNALIYNLAAALAPEYGVPLPDRQMLNKEAKTHLDLALDGGAEEASLYLQPDRLHHYGF